MTYTITAAIYIFAKRERNRSGVYWVALSRPRFRFVELCYFAAFPFLSQTFAVFSSDFFFMWKPNSLSFSRLLSLAFSAASVPVWLCISLLSDHLQAFDLWRYLPFSANSDLSSEFRSGLSPHTYKTGRRFPVRFHLFHRQKVGVSSYPCLHRFEWAGPWRFTMLSIDFGIFLLTSLALSDRFLLTEKLSEASIEWQTVGNAVPFKNPVPIKCWIAADFRFTNQLAFKAYSSIYFH